MPQVIRVLVVDDSAYIRRAVTQMLSRSPFIEVVGTARNGLDALEKVEALQPDVVTLDLEMPEMGGLAFLRAQMARRPVPVVLLSSANGRSAEVLAALDAGALEMVQKPDAMATERVLTVGDELLLKVKAAAQARLARPAAAERVELAGGASPGAVRWDIVVIGISTGGPQALKRVIPLLPASFPLPVVVVLHIPIGYTGPYAQSLDALSQLRVAEACEGEPVRPGSVLIAPAGYHLTFTLLPDVGVVTRLATYPHDTPHRPSVDVLFDSAAQVYGRRTLGVVMTGMGNDGQRGATAIKARGGAVWTEAEESCVVYGMPRAVVEAGLSDRSVPLDVLPRALVELS
jgi:two-component system, chemotaxis family, protein-glutamate methylesterase/glutaminase